MIRMSLMSLFCILAINQQSFGQEVQRQKNYSDALDPSSHTSCFCEIGAYPTNQQIFFTLGCEVWLARQYSCNYKTIILQDTSYLKTAMPTDTNALNVGYVGHWDNSVHFIDYLNNSILPFMQTRGASVFVDNTACDAMKDPENVSRFLKSQTFGPNQTLVARGNQATSIGTWDIVLPSSDNFTAEVSSTVDHVIYPDCQNYENKPCFDGVQNFETGKCIDSSSKLVELTCCPAKIAGRGPSDPPLFKWELPQNCR